MSGIAPLPLCFGCRRTVGRLDHRRDPQTDDMTFTAHCHGETEVTVITRDDMQRWGPFVLLRGTAFRKK